MLVSLLPYPFNQAAQHVFLAVAICVTVTGCSLSPRIKYLETAAEETQPFKESHVVTRMPEDIRLPASEKLTFEVRWLGIPIGTMVTAVKGIEKYQGRDAYVLEATMKTNAFLSKIYSINDRFVSYMDVEKLYTLRHEVYRRDGHYKKDAITEFDQENHRAHFKNFLDKSEKTFDIPEGVHDILSLCYYLMLLPLEVGDQVQYHVCNNEKNYSFFALVHSRVSLRLATLDRKKPREALFIQPYAKLKGKAVEKGVVDAYFSCDKRKIPLYAVIKGPIFTEVTISLSKIE